MRYPRVIRFVQETPWAILPAKFEHVKAFLAERAAGHEATEEQLAAVVRAGPGLEGRQIGSLAILPVFGVIAHRANLMTEISGATSTDKLTQALRRAAEDPNVSAIVLDVNSPGGTVVGVPELASEVMAAREKKPVVAVANGMAASAAYWIAAAASEVVVIPSGQVGSIGVFAAHDDVSKALEREGVKTTLVSSGKYKTEGNPYEPLGDDARAEMQRRVDAYHDMFVQAVARGRGVTPSRVRSGFGEGRLLLAKDALAAGMVDRVATMDDTLVRLLSKARRREAPRAEMTIRDFEAFLRDAGGFSHADARRIASVGFKAEPDPRDEGGAAAGCETDDTQQALRELEALWRNPNDRGS